MALCSFLACFHFLLIPTWAYLSISCTVKLAIASESLCGRLAACFIFTGREIFLRLEDLLGVVVGLGLFSDLLPGDLLEEGASPFLSRDL